MRYLLILVFALLLTLMSFAQEETPEATEEASAGFLFDDFSYTAPDDETLAENGWIIREGEGWPGVPNAIWRAENVSFLTDPEDESNTVLQMESSTDGTNSYQTQICHQRKYYEGTYAARVFFSNDAATGPDGDQVVQTFYLISPQEFNMDPAYSETDFEYLPNGGWGNPSSVFFATTWETFQLEPWIAENQSGIERGDYSGWHTLLIQIGDEAVTYYVDGELFASHGDEYYPEVPMSINFNHWFINGGLSSSTEERSYIEQIDWVFFQENTLLDTETVLETVDGLREEEIKFNDTVPVWEPELESPCNF